MRYYLKIYDGVADFANESEFWVIVISFFIRFLPNIYLKVAVSTRDVREQFFTA